MSPAPSTRSSRRRSQRRRADAARTPVAGGTAVAPAPTSFQPIHLGIVGTVVAASAGVLLVQGTRVENIVFVLLAVVCAGVVAGLVHRTLSPLAADAPREEPEMVGGRTRAALERDKALALRAIKELEFDRAMGKVSEADCQEMIGRLRSRALRLMRQLDEGETGYRAVIEREVQARLAAMPDAPPAAAPVPPVEADPALCGACGTQNDPDARFCKKCGARVGV